MLDLYETTDCVLHGIGDAQTMASVRNTSDEERMLLEEEGAKGEAFGYYFDRRGTSFIGSGLSVSKQAILKEYHSSFRSRAAQ